MKIQTSPFRIFGFLGATTTLANHGMVERGGAIALTEKEARYVEANNPEEFLDSGVLSAEYKVLTKEQVGEDPELDEKLAAALALRMEQADADAQKTLEEKSPEEEQEEEQDAPEVPVGTEEAPPAVGEDVALKIVSTEQAPGDAPVQENAASVLLAESAPVVTETPSVVETPVAAAQVVEPAPSPKPAPAPIPQHKQSKRDKKKGKHRR